MIKRSRWIALVAFFMSAAVNGGDAKSSDDRSSRILRLRQPTRCRDLLWPGLQLDDYSSRLGKCGTAGILVRNRRPPVIDSTESDRLSRHEPGIQWIDAERTDLNRNPSVIEKFGHISMATHAVTDAVLAVPQSDFALKPLIFRSA